MNTRRTGNSSKSAAVLRQKRPPRRRLEASLAVGPVRIQRTAVRGSGWTPAKLLSLWVIGLLLGLLRTAEAAITQASPYVSDVRVRFRLPGRIRLDVTERAPVIMWQTAQGTAWVDRTGVALPPLARGPDAPLLQVLDTQGDAMAAANDAPALGPGGLPVVHMQAPLVAALLSLQELAICRPSWVCCGRSRPSGRSGVKCLASSTCGWMIGRSYARDGRDVQRNNEVRR